MSGEERLTTATKRGLPPGTVVHVGRKHQHKPEILLTRYNKDVLVEKHPATAEDAAKKTTAKGVTWIHVTGLHDTSLLEHFGSAFNLHPLILEDIANTEQRTKIEIYDEAVFIVCKHLSYTEKGLKTEHISIIITPQVVMSFQEGAEDIFGPVRERLKTGKRIRSKKEDYLVYALLDTIVDEKFSVIDELQQRLQAIEMDILKGTDTNITQDIQKANYDVGQVRNSTWPLREVLNSILRGDINQVHESTQFYFRDVYDHIIQINDSQQSMKEQASNLMDVYMSTQSNRMNEVMKVLTIISTIFIPLTFITGLYGMNFQYMPELYWEYSYIVVLLVMAVMAFGLLWWFKRKRWL